MSTRPPLAASQRQPQRTLSGSGLSQRPPAHQRTLSQQYLPQSPIRRSESFHEQQPADAGDGAQNRFGAALRRGGSRLKLELENDGIDHAGFSESPQNLDPMSANKVFTPSRVMSINDASELGDMSPRTSRCQTADGDSTPLPMPPRRARFAVPAKRPHSSSGTSAPAKKDARPKPFVLETPSIAPRYPNIGKSDSPGVADFYRWNGNHPEDQFSDAIIRFGYFDKAPAQPAQETNSAKGPLFPSLKHKSGLNTLSNIFTTILNQRRHSGQITSASTFKPPPRVTLTDTKREVWLKDLANPAISLRRLSRTIPHGIRGKVLLDQCLNKNVPTDRAVWLAKCVGANEIRAFKRKGVNGTFVMGGEAKWIRDWTVFVEQFVETVINAFSEEEWKTRVTYAIRLATHLYAEHLLDRDHYMEWLVSGLENSNQAKLPMWLLIIQIYWKDILKLRRHGRRLVSAILAHHSSIYNHPDRDILLPLATRLESLVESLLLTSPASFINPNTWFKYRDSLQGSFSQNDESRSKILQSLDSRNDRLISSNVKSQPAIRGIVVQLLDKILRVPYDEEVPTLIWKASENKFFLVRTILEWCTSLYRPGVAKVYVATTLLCSLANFDVDITRAILEFLEVDPLQDLARKQLVYHVVSELARSGHFVIPQYMTWLITRGGLSGPADTLPDGPCATRLLVEIPIHTLKQSIRDLRATLLRRGSFSVDEQTSDITLAITHIKHTLSIPLGPHDPPLQKPLTVKKLAKRIGLSSRALKSAISSWLSNEFIGGVAQNLQSGKSGVELPLTTFETVRALLEAAEDFTMLENVLKLMLQSASPELLAYCADTVNLHLPVFVATGAAKSLSQALYDRLKAVSEQQGIGARPLLASLANLVPRLPGFEEMATQLKNDLIRLDRSSAVDASSPLSDNMATQLQDAETELSEQIEKLASYTSADRSTMERLFQTITTKLQTCWGKADERQRPYCILLTRLRVFDTQHFNTLMRGWVRNIRKLTRRPPIAQIFPLLISSGCLSLDILFATAPRSQVQATQFQPSAVGDASVYMQEILQLLTTPLRPSQAMTSEDCYRFRIIQEQARLEHAREVMPLIRGALAEYLASGNHQAPIAQPLDDEKTRHQLLQLLRTLVLVDPNAASQTLSLKSPDPKLALLIEGLTTKLLVPHGGGGQKSFEQVLELANEFTLPFCQVKLSLKLAIDDANTPEGAEKLHSQLELLSKAMDNAIDAKNIMWTGMLPSLSPEITQHMRNRAEARFLDLIPSLKNYPQDAVANDCICMAENLMTVIDTIFRGSPAPKSPPLSNALVDRLTDLWDILASGRDDHVALKGAVLAHWLPLLLSYLTLYTSPPTTATDASKLSGSGGGEIRGRALITLAGLVQELDNFYPSTNYYSDQNPNPDLSSLNLDNNNNDNSNTPTNEQVLGLGERALDIALVLVDGLPEDARLQCVRAVKDATSDPRLRYLFSFAPVPAQESLVLAHREKPQPQLGPQHQHQQQQVHHQYQHQQQQERRAAAAAAMNMGMGGAGAGAAGSMGSGVWGPGGIGGAGTAATERLTPFAFRRWEILNEPTPNVGENDTSLSLTLFDARKIK
ncbi:hypothetical protein F5B20DRAFT_301980 [Whalleya microplaca]|nr:hypothetical protein F5B20DRAFT_301980 [Whalleya microplaca]